MNHMLCNCPACAPSTLAPALESLKSIADLLHELQHEICTEHCDLEDGEMVHCEWCKKAIRIHQSLQASISDIKRERITVHVTLDPKAGPDVAEALGAAIAKSIKTALDKEASEGKESGGAAP